MKKIPMENLMLYLHLLSYEERLNTVAYRVFMYLLPNLIRSAEINEKFRPSGVFISGELSMTKSDVSKAIKILIEIGIIEAEIVSQRIKYITLNRHYLGSDVYNKKSIILAIDEHMGEIII